MVVCWAVFGFGFFGLFFLFSVWFEFLFTLLYGCSYYGLASLAVVALFVAVIGGFAPFFVSPAGRCFFVRFLAVFCLVGTCCM